MRARLTRLVPRGVLLIAVAVSGCSSYTPPLVRPNLQKEKEVAAPVEAVWRGVIRYFGTLNIPIENLDHSSFFIKTRPVDLGTSFEGLTFTGSKTPIKTSACDCGTASMANVWSSATRILLSFNVILEKRTDSTTNVTVNTFFDGVKLGKRNLYASGYDTEMHLTCLSTGNFERDLVGYLERVPVE